MVLIQQAWKQVLDLVQELNWAREEHWLKKSPYPLLSRHFYCVHQVIWSHRAPADLRWIIVNLKGSSGVHICGLLHWQEGTRTMGWKDGQGRLRGTSMNEKNLNECSLPFMLPWYYQVDSFVCFFFISCFFLFNFLPNSSFPFLPPNDHAAKECLSASV